MMYTRHGAVGGRGGAREGTGKLGFTAAPGFTSADTFSPAFDWDDGVPAYQKPPFIDATLNTGFTTERPTGGSVAFDNPEEGARPPRYQNWNFSIQRAITSSMTLTAGYVGGNGKLLRGGGLGIWSMADSSALSRARQSADVAGECDHACLGARDHPGYQSALREFPRHFLADAAAVPAVQRGQRGLRESGQLELQLAPDHAAEEDVVRADLQHQSHLEQDDVRRATLAGRTAYFWRSRRRTARAIAGTSSTRWWSTNCRSAEASDRSVESRGRRSGQRLAAVEHHAASLGSALSASSALPASCRTPAAAARPTTRPSTAPSGSTASGAAAICWARGRHFSTRRHS